MKAGCKRKLPDGAKLPVFLSANNLKPFIPDDLAMALSEPIIYVGVKGGQANGVEAKWMLKILAVCGQALAWHTQIKVVVPIQLEPVTKCHILKVSLK